MAQPRDRVTVHFGVSEQRPHPLPMIVRLGRVLLVPLMAAVLFVAFTLGPVLAAPGTDPTVARVAEWAREWGLGDLVTGAERALYEAEKPPEGGSLPAGIPSTGTVDSGLKPIPARALPALPGEGQWQDLLKVRGRTVARVAFLRPDDTHTSFSVGVVLLDPRALAFRLHQGTHVPGGRQVAPEVLTPDERKTVLATFNSGFQLKDAAGGYWQNGTTISPLVSGAASMVFGKDGSLTVESWPGGNPGPDVAAVRQNLVLMVDRGEITPQVTDPSGTHPWGATVGDKAFVWRTAIGVRLDGTVVFVVGPALTVETLASIARDAGAVEAMELDINKDWTNFIWYSHPGPTPHKLTDDEVPNAARYLSTSTRDFVAVLPR